MSAIDTTSNYFAQNLDFDMAKPNNSLDENWFINEAWASSPEMGGLDDSAVFEYFSQAGSTPPTSEYAGWPATPPSAAEQYCSPLAITAPAGFSEYFGGMQMGDYGSNDMGGLVSPTALKIEEDCQSPNPRKHSPFGDQDGYSAQDAAPPAKKACPSSKTTKTSSKSKKTNSKPDRRNSRSSNSSTSSDNGKHGAHMRTAARKSKTPSSPGSDGNDSDDLNNEERRARRCHNQVEKQYRDRLNAHFERLLTALPADDVEAVGGGDDRRLSKAAVLDMARRRITALEQERSQLRVERQNLLENVARLQQLGVAV